MGWPWTSRAQAEVWRVRALAAELANERLRGDIRELHRAHDAMRIERDDARGKLERRSLGVSKGNRTRSARRRAASAPPLMMTPHQGEQGTSQTG